MTSADWVEMKADRLQDIAVYVELDPEISGKVHHGKADPGTRITVCNNRVPWIQIQETIVRGDGRQVQMPAGVWSLALIRSIAIV